MHQKFQGSKYHIFFWNIVTALWGNSFSFLPRTMFKFLNAQRSALNSFENFLTGCSEIDRRSDTKITSRWSFASLGRNQLTFKLWEASLAVWVQVFGPDKRKLPIWELKFLKASEPSSFAWVPSVRKGFRQNCLHYTPFTTVSKTTYTRCNCYWSLRVGNFVLPIESNSSFGTGTSTFDAYPMRSLLFYSR